MNIGLGLIALGLSKYQGNHSIERVSENVPIHQRKKIY